MSMDNSTPRRAGTGAPERVVILGGGVGGITTAFALTQPELAGRYDVTLYQMGWRLGGKGASGRNAAQHQRIEEHGLHIWLGFYVNAVRLMRQCYEELGRDPSAPLASFDTAFSPQYMGTLMDDGVDGSQPWSRWNIPLPITTDEVGGGEHPSAVGYLEMLVQWLADALVGGFEVEVHADGLPKALWRALNAAVHGGSTLLHDAAHLVGEWRRGVAGTVAARELVHSACAHLQAHAHAVLHGGSATPAQRRLAQLFDIACATIVGLYDGGVFTEGQAFDTLDDRDLLQFLKDHGCDDASQDSPLLRGYFDLAFGFKRGELGQRHENAAAGTAIDAILRVCFAYRGAFMWRMNAGMGDTIFAPYYEVLRRRGVKFRFFHRVVDLVPGTDPASGAPRIEQVRLARQVDVKGGDDAYRPLVDVKGLPCWPSEAPYDQLVQGQALRDGPGGRPHDLESMWSGWTDVDPDVVLGADDFEHLVLAIPVGSHPVIAARLMQASERFRQMVHNVLTVQTFGVQVWLDPGVEALGWQVPMLHGQPQRAVCDAYADPLNSFADNTHLLPREDWTAPTLPQTLLYFCGPLADECPPLRFPPPSDTGFPQRQADRVKAMALDWFSRHTRAILPSACMPDTDGLDWALLTDAQGRQGQARFDAQYWCANVDPSERYVLSVAGSTRFRLAAGDSQFGNMVLAGDWVANGFAVGCVESATLGGLQAARAITGDTGDTAPIHGERTQENWAARRSGRRAGQPPAGASASVGTLPRYVPPLTDLQLPPPYRFSKLSLRSFPLRGDPRRIQQVVDRLNIAPPEVCEVRALGNLVYMQLAQYPYLQSKPDPLGWFTENELSFNILVAVGKRVNGQFVPQSLAYHFPFIYVDNDWAIATGREVFGYDKISSEMHFGEAQAPSLFSLDTLALPRLGSDEAARRVQLVEIIETRHRSGFDAWWHKLTGVASEAAELLFGDAGLLDQSSLALWDAVGHSFARDEVGIVSLKQFRDAEDPAAACYQALVSTTFKVERWGRRSLLDGEYAVRIATEASMPIVSSLGLEVDAEGLVRTGQPFALEFDCTVSTGTNLWVAR